MSDDELPMLDVVAPDGRRVRVSGLGRDATVATLAAAIDAPSLSIDDEPLDPVAPLTTLDGLRTGVAFTSPASSADLLAVRRMTRDPAGPVLRGSTPERGDGPVRIAVVDGPDCSTWRPLGVGRHVVGRAASSAIRLHDPDVERHHALLDVGVDGTVRFVQLVGHVPAHVDGRPASEALVRDGEHEIEIGSSTLRIEPSPRSGDHHDPDGHVHDDDHSGHHLDDHPDDRSGVGGGSISPHVSDPWRRVVWRAPHHRPSFDSPSIPVPSPPGEGARPTATGLIGAAVAAVVAVVVTLATGSTMFLVFGAAGVVAATATWLAGAVSVRRANRRGRETHRVAVERFARALDDLRSIRTAHHGSEHPHLLAAVHAIDGLAGSLWSRRIETDADPTVTLGRGRVRWTPPVDDGERGRPSDATIVALLERAGRLDGVSAPLTIRRGEVVALRGDRRRATGLARSVVVQLAAWYGPVDWRLVVVTRSPCDWTWTDWLPHGGPDGVVLDAADDDRAAAELGALDAGRRTVVVTDDPMSFTSRTGPLRRFLATSGASAIVVVGLDDTVPAVCRRVLSIGSTTASWVGDVPDGDAAERIAVAGLTVASAGRLARRLACLVDPEDADSVDAALPESLTFSRLVGGLPDPEGIARRWSSAGDDPAPRARLGRSGDGVVDVDLVRDGPHGLVAGTTGSGKSELLRSLVLGLAVESSPRDLTFVLVDYKGGSTFDACARLPHTVGVVTDLDDGLAERALVSLGAELHRRERLLRSVGASDLADYRSRPDRDPIARLVVVIDEFAALAAELPDFLAALVGIAQRGRSLGIHLLLATQRPSGVVDDDIRANTNLRLALRLHDRADAVDVVGDPTPAQFPRGRPGRAALRLGPDELVVFQSAWSSGPVVPDAERGVRVRRDHDVVDPDVDDSEIGDAVAGDTVAGDRPDGLDTTEIAAVVDAVVAATELAGLPAAHRPWTDPLPHPLLAADITAVDTDTTRTADAHTDTGDTGTANTDSDDRTTAVGVVDDPEHQCRRPLRWTPADGNLALVGSLGAGTSSTLVALATSICRTAGPADAHLYVVDARGDGGLEALAPIAHCGGVVAVGDDERMHRLFRRLVDEIDRRRSSGGPGGMEGTPSPTSTETPDRRHVVLMIDGWSSLRASLQAVERADLHDAVRRVLADGPAVGVVTVLTDDSTSPSSASLPVGDRWVFHLDDPAIARGLGIRTAPVRAGRPGRLRIASTGLEAQVALGAPGLASLPTHDDDPSGPDPIRVLPARVDGPLRSGSRRSVATDRRIVVGIGGDHLTPDGPAVPAGDPIVVVGAARTGVSTTLEQIAEAWSDATDITDGSGGREVVRVDRRRPLDPDLVARRRERPRPLLVVVDDAHRVDDVDGVLLALARGEHPGATLLVGARADAVRSAYGHWTREAAKARCGIVMSSRGDPDGDVLGVDVPRRPLVPARAGLGWIVDDGPLRLVQVALGRDDAGAGEPTPAS